MSETTATVTDVMDDPSVSAGRSIAKSLVKIVYVIGEAAGFSLSGPVTNYREEMCVRIDGGEWDALLKELNDKYSQNE